MAAPPTSRPRPSTAGSRGARSVVVVGAQVWGRYWRDREYLADVYAAQLGAGEQLILALETEAIMYDRPCRSSG